MFGVFFPNLTLFQFQLILLRSNLLGASGLIYVLNLNYSFLFFCRLLSCSSGCYLLVGGIFPAGAVSAVLVKSGDGAIKACAVFQSIRIVKLHFATTVAIVVGCQWNARGGGCNRNDAKFQQPGKETIVLNH